MDAQIEGKDNQELLYYFYMMQDIEQHEREIAAEENGEMQQYVEEKFSQIRAKFDAEFKSRGMETPEWCEEDDHYRP
jgi:hypothetical protein